jgi:hypothetical protein
MDGWEDKMSEEKGWGMMGWMRSEEKGCGRMGLEEYEVGWLEKRTWHAECEGKRKDKINF